MQEDVSEEKKTNQEIKQKISRRLIIINTNNEPFL